MTQDLSLSVFEIVGTPLCVASDDGQRVHDRIAAALKDKRKVILSFLNITSVTSAFLNAAIGQLYGEFSEDAIRAGLQVADMAQDDLALLKRVVETAKTYFKDREGFNRAVNEVLGDEADAK
ncbi:MAG TPA: STAS-like domain-containing protein [Terriglobia bacterium]|nr:STAS-like domain-containing protein [Terriglobia bacterium]